jgi:hypothetical protein
MQWLPIELQGQTEQTLPPGMQEEEVEEVTPSALEEVGAVEAEVVGVEAEEAEAVLQAQEEDPTIMAKISYSANTLTRSLEIDRKHENS